MAIPTINTKGLKMGKDDQDLLENLIDRHGLAGVLRAMADICFGKAECVAHYWQDVRTAKQWMKHGAHVERLASGHLKGAN
jgi:hypothetical protein